MLQICTYNLLTESARQGCRPEEILTQGTEKGWSICTDALTPSPTSPISVVGMCDANDRCVSSPKFPEKYGKLFFCSITFATLHVVEFAIELSYDVSCLEDWVVDACENPAAQPGWIYQAPDRWPCEAVYGCSLCSSISARGAHERYVVAARVCAGSLESSEPFEVSADGQRSRVDPHGTQFVDENGVTLRGWIDSEDLTLREPDARVQLAAGNAETWIVMECHDDRLCVIMVGICAVVCVTAYLRGFEEDSRSEVVFWIDEWSIEFGYHWLDVAHVHDHSPLSAPLCRY